MINCMQNCVQKKNGLQKHSMHLYKPFILYKISGAIHGIQTHDLSITNRMLYQLS